MVGPQRRVLVLAAQPAVERDDVHRQPAEPARDGADLTGARQEHQDVAGLLGEGTAHGGGDVVEEPRVDPQPVRRRDPGRRRAPERLDRVQHAGRLDDGRGAVLAEGGGEPVGVHGRGRREHAQVRAQRRPDVCAEGDREVGVEVPLVDLVEDHGADAGQLGVGEQPLDQQPGRDDLDPGARRRARLPAHAEPDGPADPFTEQ